MNLEELIPPAPAQVPAPAPAQAQAQAQVPAQVPDERLLASLKGLEERVKATETRFDDIALEKEKEKLRQQFEVFKAANPTLNVDEFFKALDEKFNEYLKQGATPEQAQALMNTVYMNPVGWSVVLSELKSKSEAKAPDSLTKEKGVPSQDQTTPPTRATLGALMSKGAKNG